MNAAMGMKFIVIQEKKFKSPTTAPRGCAPPYTAQENNVFTDQPKVLSSKVHMQGKKHIKMLGDNDYI